MEALNHSSYVSDDDELSELSEVSASDSDKEDALSQAAYRTSVQRPGEGTTTKGTPLNRAAKRKARMKEASKRNRQKRKTNELSERQVREDLRLANKHLRHAEPVASSYNGDNFNISATGYIGKRKNGDERTYSLDEMVGEDSIFKFTLKKWDGRLVSSKHSGE